jgi:hypothetical protein
MQTERSGEGTMAAGMGASLSASAMMELLTCGTSCRRTRPRSLQSTQARTPA